MHINLKATVYAEKGINVFRKNHQCLSDVMMKDDWHMTDVQVLAFWLNKFPLG